MSLSELEKLREDIPQFTAEQLADASPQDLLDWLGEQGDFAPRSLFDACVARGEEMVACLEAFHSRQPMPIPDLELTQEWWMLLHSVNVLGMIEGHAAGELLVRVLRRLDSYDDEAWEWVTEDWPWLFANKPAAVIAQLRDMLHDRGLGWHTRSYAATAVIAAAMADGDEQALESTLDQIAAQLQIVESDEREPWYRSHATLLLLDFPRERHRQLLRQWAQEQQEDEFAMFDETDIDEAFEKGVDIQDWLEREPPWSFYDDEQIIERMQQWLQREAFDDAEFNPDGFFDDRVVSMPYVRNTSKVGRNDPCPCGSGKKYKKCCLATTDDDGSLYP